MSQKIEGSYSKTLVHCFWLRNLNPGHRCTGEEVLSITGPPDRFHVSLGWRPMLRKVELAEATETDILQAIHVFDDSAFTPRPRQDCRGICAPFFPTYFAKYHVLCRKS
jgi:hypothetical protein